MIGMPLLVKKSTFKDMQTLVISGDLDLNERRDVYARKAGIKLKMTDDDIVAACAATDDDDDEMFVNNVNSILATGIEFID
jgi:hypothetical protein